MEAGDFNYSLHPHWLQIMFNDDAAEKARPRKLLVMKGRQMVWWLSCKMDVKAPGIPGQACQLLERYLTEVRHKYELLATSDSSWWHQFREKITRHLPLMICVCIWLATKMDSLQNTISASFICETLFRLKISLYLPKNINELQLEIFKHLDYCLPLWTNTQKACMLAKEVGLNGWVLEGVSSVVDLAEFHLPSIKEQVKRVMTHSTAQGSSDVPRLVSSHFCAGAVSATNTYMSEVYVDYSEQLAKLVRTTPAYIKCIADAILKQVTEDCAD